MAITTTYCGFDLIRDLNCPQMGVFDLSPHYQLYAHFHKEKNFFLKNFFHCSPYFG